MALRAFLLRLSAHLGIFYHQAGCSPPVRRHLLDDIVGRGRGQDGSHRATAVNRDGLVGGRGGRWCRSGLPGPARLALVDYLEGLQPVQGHGEGHALRGAKGKVGTGGNEHRGGDGHQGVVLGGHHARLGGVLPFTLDALA